MNKIFRMNERGCHLAILLCCVCTMSLLCPRTTHAFTTEVDEHFTTEMNELFTTEMEEYVEELQLCEFDTYLDPFLPCEMLDPEAQHYYQPGQQFCACPPFSECISKKEVHPITMDLEMMFMCFKKPAYADKAHEDMTMGLLRDNDLDD